MSGWRCHERCSSIVAHDHMHTRTCTTSMTVSVLMC